MEKKRAKIVKNEAKKAKKRGEKEKKKKEKIWLQRRAAGASVYWGC
jgi:hypothetical protein